MKSSCCHSKKIIPRENNLPLCANVSCANYMHSTAPYSARRWNNVSFTFFFFFFFILTFNDYSYNTSPSKRIGSIRKSIEEKIPLTEENLKNQLNSNHIICPEQVYAQIMIESGHLNSYLTKKTNNLLGMRYPFKRKTSACGIFLPSSNLIIKGTQAELKKYRNQNNYAVYDSWEDCVKDYKYWQVESFKLTELYLAFLGNYYAEDSSYVDKIKKITN
jgi:hypothetical protein